MKYSIRFLPLTALVGLASASAAPLITEPFDYPDGGITSVSGGVWANTSGTGTFIQVAGGQVANLTAGSGSREDVNRSFGTSLTSGVVFAGLDLTISTPPAAGGGGDYFLHFTDSNASNFRARVFVYGPGQGAGTFRLGLENDSASTALLSGELAINTTHRIVVAYDLDAKTSRLWINSTDPNSPTLTDGTAATSNANLGRIGLRQGGAATYSGLTVDHLIVGTVFVDVSSFAPIPEPSATALLALGAGLVALRRRR